ncbi:DUF5777 family beta-barrel protein [Marinoscillum sp. MHG1-6]|uniref:DUF5777 family beta-barrel protein n=1 Tax=Marinoscillum sp. MHG1-6 TaxID=2959627 RepID=UPI002158783A|nr:DUF5777 family beta-barrel protein [Marinoscillum sp. MHG1-6]
MKKTVLSSLLAAIAFLCHAQSNYTYGTFDDTRIVNGHSVETNTEGVLKFIISHRFEKLNSGAQDAWGLDFSTMRIGLDYGITNRFTVGLGRSTFEKTVDTYLKYKLLRQSSGEKNTPITLTLLGTVAWKTQNPPDDPLFDDSRFAYTFQLLMARKLTDRLSAQIMPTILHRNVVSAIEENDILSLGFAAQYHVTQNISLSAEYYATPSSYLPEKSDLGANDPEYNQSLAIGIQFDTKGHIFQLHFGNSRGMIEKFFVGETRGSWLDGDIHFGFNITRDFKIKGRKIR